jgi:hypothetical protein
MYKTLNVAAWNIRSIGNKESELVEEIKFKVINVAVISETKKKLKGTKMTGYLHRCTKMMFGHTNIKFEKLLFIYGLFKWS